MTKLRFKAVQTAISRKPVSVSITKKQSSLFGENVFNLPTMRQNLTKEAYQAVKDAIDKGSKIDRLLANQIAEAMKSWAMSKNVTHYTHWFQPLTGSTAEKHDSFLQTTNDCNLAIEQFSGESLVQQEPDASSFPNGGIRNTFEARGYTAWDPTSPAFIIGNTLTIPTIFVAYTGEALDYKTPLLRALRAVDEAATNVCKYFDKNVTKVNSSLGWEQEYFLLDKAMASSRPDIVLTGRTLLGHDPAKGQQLDDHYFGSIPDRTLAFMSDLEHESMLLGIPVKTRHNEVAPTQFELAPIYEETNLAVDHNLLIMDLMQKIAKDHDLEVLLHEKPYNNINGSGKHNNWSLSTNTGVNLLSPGKTPIDNLQFLTFFICTINAVHKNEELLRATIASAGNDHRLGANEAPPAIISIFIGSQLTSVLNKLSDGGDKKLTPEQNTNLKLNVAGKIPEIFLDNCDRNRTSPFAFTGNKFEFRAVGSSQNSANPMTILNTIVAKQLKDFKKEVDTIINDKSVKVNDAIFEVLKTYIKSSKAILFEGDGYSKKWEKEAVKRGLSNNKNTPQALKAKITNDAITLYEEMKIFTKKEALARYEIELENYIMKIQIESRVLGDIARNHIIPAVISYQNLLVQNVSGLKEIFNSDYMKHAEEQLILIKMISKHIKQLNSEIGKMIEKRKYIESIENLEEKARLYCNDIKPYLNIIRHHCDSLELVVDNEIWPLTKYRELLFL